jgi:hypothetical protein
MLGPLCPVSEPKAQFADTTKLNERLQQDSQCDWMLAGCREMTKSICFGEGGGRFRPQQTLMGEN